MDNVHQLAEKKKKKKKKKKSLKEKKGVELVAQILAHLDHFGAGWRKGDGTSLSFSLVLMAYQLL